MSQNTRSFCVMTKVSLGASFSCFSENAFSKWSGINNFSVVPKSFPAAAKCFHGDRASELTVQIVYTFESKKGGLKSGGKDSTKQTNELL